MDVRFERIVVELVGIELVLFFFFVIVIVFLGRGRIGWRGRGERELVISARLCGVAGEFRSR